MRLNLMVLSIVLCSGNAMADLSVQMAKADEKSVGAGVGQVVVTESKYGLVFTPSLMIHAGGDNHADHPAPRGGGGARMVCGVIR